MAFFQRLRALLLIGLVLVLAACNGALDAESEPAPAEDPEAPADDENGEDPATEADAAGDLTSVNVGIVPYEGLAPLYLGIDRGFFAEEGLELDVRHAQSPAPILASVLSGEYAFGFSTTVTLIRAISEGAEVTAVAPVEGVVDPDVAASALLVADDSDIQTMADLEGRAVAVPGLESLLDLLVRVLVDRDGGDVGAVEIVQVPFPEMPDALASGRVDGIAAVEPFISIASDQGARMISPLEAATLPHASVTVFAASDSLITEDPETVEGFRRAMDRSLEYSRENPDEVIAIIPTFTDYDPEQLQDLETGYLYEAGINEESVAEMADLMVQYGFLESAPPLDDILYQP